MTQLKAPLQSAIMTGYNWAKARAKWLEYSKHSQECAEQMINESGDNLYYYEAGEIIADMKALDAHIVREYSRIHRAMAELNRSKGSDDVTDADYLERGVIHR